MLLNRFKTRFRTFDFDFNFYSGVKRYRKPVYSIKCELCKEEALLSEQDLVNHVEYYNSHNHINDIMVKDIPTADHICPRCFSTVVNLSRFLNTKSYDYE